MASRIKLITGGIVLLASGASSFSILSNISSPSSPATSTSLNLSPPNWGSVSQSPHLEINNSLAINQGVNLSEQPLQNVNLELTTHAVSNLELPQSTPVNTKKSSVQIKNIMKEIKKEEAVQKVQGFMNSKTNFSKKRIRRQIPGYEQTLQSIQKSTSRSKKIYQHGFLTAGQRKSLHDHFKEFTILEHRRNDILERLEKVKNNGKVIPIKKIPRDHPYIEILGALDEIKWSSSEGIIKYKTSSESTLNFGWGDWKAQNPYRYFFNNEEEWKKLVEGSLKNKKTLKRDLAIAQKLKTSQSKSPLKFFKLMKTLKASKDNLELKIARKLLEVMGQIEPASSTVPESST